MLNPLKFTDAEADLDMIKGMIEDTLLSTEPAMVLNLKTSVPNRLVSKLITIYFLQQANGKSW